jgi:hypothetical protein
MFPLCSYWFEEELKHRHIRFKREFLFRRHVSENADLSSSNDEFWGADGGTGAVLFAAHRRR